MSEQQSIREEMSETLFRFYDHGTQPNALVEADALLASPVIRRIQAEAWAVGFNDATDEAHTAHEEYPARHENPYRDEAE